jgi:type IV pilus assembly protein PilB
MLQELNGPDRALTTIEDPVEIVAEGVDQIELDPRTGLTFANGLRTILRSDSDVVLVGELRDDETRRLAISAAITGRLVLSALQTRTAAAVVQRLVDGRLEPSLVADALTCVVGTRLARRICTDCREPYFGGADDIAALALPPEDEGRRLLARGRGCETCGGTGYHGRVGLHEVLYVTDEIRGLIASGASTTEIERSATESGMRTLREDGIRLCLEGITTVAELRRIGVLPVRPL